MYKRVKTGQIRLFDENAHKCSTKNIYNLAYRYRHVK